MSIHSILEARIAKEVEQLDQDLATKPQAMRDGFGFMLHVLRCFFKFHSTSAGDIEEGIVDSAYRSEKHDYGIDAVYLTAGREFVCTPDEIDNYHDETKYTFHIMQFKKGTGIDQASLLKLKNGISKTFVNNDIDEDNNKYMERRIRTLKEVLENLYNKCDPDNINIRVTTCFSGLKSTVTDDDLLKAELVAIKDHLIESGYHKVEVEVLGANEIISLERSKGELTAILEYKDAFKYITDLDDGGKLNGFICIVNTKEIGELVKAHGDKLFEANIRSFYQKKNVVNSRIFKTCTSIEDGKSFWSFNNGLTITSHKIDELPSSKYRIHGIQIVNGCQTSNILYRALRFLDRRKELEELGERMTPEQQEEYKQISGQALNEDSTVLVKIIETKNEEVIYRITETTNSQTAIKVFSLRANEDIHKNLEDFFLQYGVYYERRVNYYKNRGLRPTVDIKRVAQLYMGVIEIEPCQARSRPKAMFLDNYDKIFPDPDVSRTNYLLYLIPVLVDLKLASLIRRIQCRKSEPDPYKQGLLSYGKIHLNSFLLKSILAGKQFSKAELVRSFDLIQSTINDDTNLLKHLNIALDILKKTTQNYAGKKKEAINSSLRKTELDRRIKKEIMRTK